MLAQIIDSVAPIVPLAFVLVLSAAVLTSIALDLRRLRRNSRLRAIHGVTGAAFTAIVVGGALTMSLALAAATTATAEQQPMDAPASAVTPSPIPEPESINTADVTDSRTDIQLPTLELDAITESTQPAISQPE